MVAVLSLLMILAPPVPPGCAWVRAENDGAGAGFVVDADKKLLVTCRHVVADRKAVDVIFPWVRDGELVTERRAYLGNRPRLRELGLLVTGKVLKTSDELDLALVELESLPAGTQAVRFAPNPSQPGDPLRVIGNRLDLDTVWNVTAGPMRSTGRLADGYFWRGKKLAVNADAIIGQLPTEEGDSGGAVLDTRGEVVGMASALRRSCPLAAIVISASAIRRFAGLPDPVANEKPKPATIAETLTRGTVWIRPGATDIHLAGVLIENDLVLTIGKGLTPGDRVGVALPIREGENWLGERAAYRDLLGLQLRGNWRSATVLARDAERDLALLRLDSSVEFLRPIPLASVPTRPGDAVHAMSHPGGLEFAWVYADGTVRQRGKVALVPGDNAKRVPVLVCQLPAQSGSPGGPLVNDRGELAGLLAAKESAQMVGYAVTVEELATFVDCALLDRPARTLSGLLARVAAIPDRLAVKIAPGLAAEADELWRAGRITEATRKVVVALSLDPGCVAARLCRARMLDSRDALAELDAAVEKVPFTRDVLLWRAGLAASVKDWRKARGDLERLLDVNPADADARQRLIGVLLGLGEDAKAAVAVSETLRANPKRLPAVAADLLEQADALAKKYPDAPSVAAGWLLKAMTAAKQPEFAETLRRANAAKDDTARLALLRDGLKSVIGE